MSDEKASSQYYDLDRDILAPARSPGLEKQANVESESTPEVLVTVSPSIVTSDDEGSDRAVTSRRPDPRKVPEQFDLVARVQRYALAGNDWSETEEEDDNEPGAEQDGMRSRNEPVQHGASTAPDRAKAVAARILQSLRDDDDDFPMIDSPDSLPGHSEAEPPSHDAQHAATTSPPSQRQMPRRSNINAILHHETSGQTWNTFPPPIPPPRSEQGQGQGLRLTLDSRFDTDNSIMRSPTLARFAIAPRNPDPETILPVLQQPLPSTSHAEAPRRRQTLPSLRTYLQSTSPASFASISPIFSRPSPGQSPYYGHSPASHHPMYPGMSPPVPPYSSWRNTTQDSFTSTPSEYTPANSATVSTPASSILAQSPVALSNPPLSIPSKPPTLAPKQLASKLPVLAPSSPPILSPPKPRSMRRSKIRTSAPSKTPAPAPSIPLPASSKTPTSTTSIPLSTTSIPLSATSIPLPAPSIPLPAPSETPTPAPSETPTPAPSSPPTLPPVPEHKAEIAEDDTDVEVEETPEQESELSLIEISPPMHLGPGPYQCSSAGCTAPPFQTQYLLNSHMNVHSESRSHFCTVKDCPRGVGGLGFKRKNEMLRHGLVHASPGYVCPFCLDQQHRYPRPDNLQRHVRVHHRDVDPHDPELRHVLDQRIEDGMRVSKRRMRS